MHKRNCESGEDYGAARQPPLKLSCNCHGGWVKGASLSEGWGGERWRAWAHWHFGSLAPLAVPWHTPVGKEEGAPSESRTTALGPESSYIRLHGLLRLKLFGIELITQVDLSSLDKANALCLA